MQAEDITPWANWKNTKNMTHVKTVTMNADTLRKAAEDRLRRSLDKEEERQAEAQQQEYRQTEVFEGTESAELKVLRLKAEVFDLSRELQPLNEQISAINAKINELVAEINELQESRQALDADSDADTGVKR